MLLTSTKGAIYNNIGRKPYGNECRRSSSSEGATSETSHNLCRTFGALFRNGLGALGCHPMLLYAI